MIGFLQLTNLVVEMSGIEPEYQWVMVPLYMCSAFSISVIGEKGAKQRLPRFIPSSVRIHKPNIRPIPLGLHRRSYSGSLRGDGSGN